MATVALVDDHILLRNGLANLLSDLGYTIGLEANNGDDFIEQLHTAPAPDIVLLDINMPKKDGYETAQWLKKNKPQVKVLALSMYDDEYAIIKMLKNGARGYILKDAEPAELKRALNAVLTRGFYHSELVTGVLIHSINQDEENNAPTNVTGLSAREIEFLKLVCSEMTYKEIADKLFVSPRTVDGYRDDLFEKLGVKSRVGLVLFAIRSGIVKI